MASVLPRRSVQAALAAAAVAAVAVSGCATPKTTAPDGSASGASSAAKAASTVGADQQLHQQLPAKIRSAGVVRVATDVPYPPFEMFTAAGSSTITGLDYDLGQAIGAKLGVRFLFTEQKFDGIVPAIQAGKFDAVMSAMTDTKKREAVLDFVDYSASGSGILVAHGNPHHITTLLDLCGQKVAVQSGSKQAAMLTGSADPCSAAGKPKVQVAQYPKDTDAQLAITSGAVIADFMDKPAAGYVAKTAGNGSQFQVIDDPKAPTGVDSTPNGIGVSKTLPGLASAIRQALQQLMDDGTYQSILKAYGESGIAIAKATMNQATS